MLKASYFRNFISSNCFRKHKKHSDLISQSENKVFQELRKKLITAYAIPKSENLKKQKKLKQRLHSLEILTAKLYEDRFQGDLSDEMFTTLIANSESERLDKENELDSLSKIEHQHTTTLNDIQNWIRLVKQNSSVQEVDRELLESLIK